MRIVFMGTPDFAVPSLKKLIEKGYDIAGVFCQPDKPKGRGHKLAFPPVKETALENGIKVFQPASLRNRESQELIKALNPEIIIVVAYGKILPKSILDIPSKGCVNVHGSLLPRYRGAAPIQRAVLNGEKITGVTTMYMAEGLDTGDILLQEETEIGEDETSPELFARLAVLGANLLVKTLENLDSLTPVKQDDSKADYSPMIVKSMSPVDWNNSSAEIHNQVRGLAEWPVATASYRGAVYKIHSGKPCEIQTDKEPGTVIQSKKKLVIACGGGTAYEIKEIQAPGRKKMHTVSFLVGNRIQEGEKFS